MSRKTATLKLNTVITAVQVTGSPAAWRAASGHISAAKYDERMGKARKRKDVCNITKTLKKTVAIPKN
jgi:hypothetical protein